MIPSPRVGVAICGAAWHPKVRDRVRRGASGGGQVARVGLD